jgi:Asp-tRNA(Asn)/Glu-tRNA(Gln) amidotransferase C subunit
MQPHYAELLHTLEDLLQAAKLYSVPDLDLREAVMREVQMRLRADLNEAMQRAERAIQNATEAAEDAAFDAEEE